MADDAPREPWAVIMSSDGPHGSITIPAAFVSFETGRELTHLCDRAAPPLDEVGDVCHETLSSFLGMPEEVSFAHEEIFNPEPACVVVLNATGNLMDAVVIPPPPHLPAHLLCSVH